MKIEKINDNKIKITFNIDDLAEKNIDLYSFMHNAPETQDLFWDLISEAEKECGFNIDNSMIYVEVSSSKLGAVDSIILVVIISSILDEVGSIRVVIIVSGVVCSKKLGVVEVGFSPDSLDPPSLRHIRESPLSANL